MSPIRWLNLNGDSTTGPGHFQVYTLIHEFMKAYLRSTCLLFNTLRQSTTCLSTGLRLLLLFTLSAGARLPMALAQCPSGFVILSSQAQVNEFPPGCVNIPGELRIRGTDINDLSPLRNLQTVRFDLVVTTNSSLTSLTGLGSLTAVGQALRIENNPQLTNLQGLNNFRSSGGLTIIGNASLTSLSGLVSFSTTRFDVEIQGNPMLTSLQGLNNLSTTGGSVIIHDNPRLPNLQGLDNLGSSGGLDIQRNQSLTSLSGVDSYSTARGGVQIRNNPALTSLQGLNNLGSSDGLDITGNALLTTLSGIDSYSTARGAVVIEDNPALLVLENLNDLDSIRGGLRIARNQSLTIVSGLNNLRYIGGELNIDDNPALVSIQGLNNLNSSSSLDIRRNQSLTSISGLVNFSTSRGDVQFLDNPALISIQGLNNLSSATSLRIERNIKLSGCAIEAICRLLASDTFRDIFGNAPGCNSVEEIQANCLSITQQPVSSSIVCAGTPVTVSISASGDIRSYQWYSNGGVVSGQTSATLTLPATTTADAGQYVVVVSSSVSSLTSTVFTLAVNPAPTVSINPSSATLTCAQPSVTLTAQGEGIVRWSTGSIDRQITVNLATTYSVTLTNASGCSASASTTIEQNTSLAAPGLQASASQTSGQPISLTATGCVGTVNWTSQGGSGQAMGAVYTFSQPGNYTLTATCSVGTCTSPQATPLNLQILPGGFAITGVTMVNCELFDEAKGGYTVRFTPQYTGANSNPIRFSVVNELPTTTAAAPYQLRLYTDNPTITLVANQAGNPEARYAYNWWASCQRGGTTNQQPTTSGVPSQSLVQNQPYQLNLTAYFSDPDGQALTYSAQGLPPQLAVQGSLIQGTPTQPGQYPVTVTALDPQGSQVSSSFVLTVNTAPAPSSFTITGVSPVSCQVISAGQRRVSFNPQYAGLDGTPVSFSVVNESLPTTAPGPYTLNLYTDNPVITLSARQGNVLATYRYNWLAACASASRLATREAGGSLQVVVLENPVTGEQVEVEVRGAEGQRLHLSLTDLQGRPLRERLVERAGVVERQRLSIDGQVAGLLLLRVSTPTQSQTVKLLRH